MDFLKRQTFLILCVLGAVTGIALAVTGIKAMPKVITEMEAAKNLYNELNSVPSQGANEDILRATERRIDSILTDRNNLVEQAKRLYARCQLLVPTALPNGKPEDLRTFRKAYQEGMRELMDSLRSGSIASTADIETMKEKIADETARRKLMGPMDRNPEEAEEGPPMTPAGVRTKAGVREEAIPRAHIAAAQRIYCYAVDYQSAQSGKPGQEKPALDIAAHMSDVGTAEAPLPYDVWWAQINYWIQKDIIDVIVDLNNAAAEAARQQDRDRWVGIMPVKEIVSIRLSSGFVVHSEDEFTGSTPEGFDPALPPAAPRTAFTHHASNEFYDIMQYTVKLVMDQRDIPEIMKRLTANTFHIPLRIAYSTVNPNRSMIGKIYGAEPAVLVVMDFEFLMFGDVFRRWMPQSVCEEYQINCPEPVEAEEGS